MQAVPLLDELMANAWRPVITEIHGGWRYRWADGMTRRANSALAGGADEDAEVLLARAETFYGERGARALIQVSSATAPPSLVTYLHARGYRSTARTLVKQAATREVIDRSRPASCEIEIEIAEAPSDTWFDTYWSVEATRGRSGADMEVCRRVLLAPQLPMAFAAARRGSEVIGVGQLVIERGWGGVQCMATGRAHRREGVARTVLTGLAEAAVRGGAGRMYLAVEADNRPARALYADAGFRAAHDYSYFVAQPD